MKVCILFVTLFGCGLSFPLQDAKSTLLREGDMLLTKDQMTSLYNPPTLRNGLRNGLKVWPKGLVYYKFSPGFRKLITVYVR